MVRMLILLKVRLSAKSPDAGGRWFGDLEGAGFCNENHRLMSCCVPSWLQGAKTMRGGWQTGTEFTAVPCCTTSWWTTEVWAFCPTDLLKDNGNLIAQPQHWRRLSRKRRTVRCGRIEVQGLAKFPHFPADWESNLHGSQLILLFNIWGILCGSGRCPVASPTGVDERYNEHHCMLTRRFWGVCWMVFSR